MTIIFVQLMVNSSLSHTTLYELFLKLFRRLERLLNLSFLLLDPLCVDIVHDF